jgi:hypothetical protein
MIADRNTAAMLERGFMIVFPPMEMGIVRRNVLHLLADA